MTKKQAAPLTESGPCGFKRKYKIEEQAKVAAKALSMRYLECPECKTFHLTKGMGKRP